MTLAAELAQSARMVASVAAGKSLAEQFDEELPLANASRAALIDLTHGTLRRYGRSPAIVRELSSRARSSDDRVEALLWCAFYAVDSGRYREHTLVDQAVKACVFLEQWSAKGYVNALLRRYLRERAAIDARISRDEEAAHQHPRWWIELVRRAYPQAWQQVLAAGNSHPPMGLRLNRRRAEMQTYEGKLAQHGMTARRIGAQSLILERPVPVERLPGFASGEVSVQDIGAQRAARLLDAAAGERVLDACAAPGGKTAHILELADVALTALDVNAGRAARMAPNLERLGLHAEVRVGDAAEPAHWWNGVPFERILADVPCSASGIARRHPDVKWLRRVDDLASFATRQGSILAGLWRVLAPGGKLLYASCSVFPEENESVVCAFLASQPDAQRLPLSDGQPAQWLPGAEHDGFYYALIEKRA
ncbi:MAG: 16S rRNA (cytosine(967)-C(5))-methyltransferase RsmB [Burkholderiales bacterium]